MTAVAERPLEHDSSGRPLWHGLGYPLAVWAGTRALVYVVLAMQGWTSRRHDVGFGW